MLDIIHLLPDSVANQIAAGEVIQRPSSAVKELLENAIDAKSTIINLLITDAGRTLIRIIDNGIGMSETDARMCFERHATSKIKYAHDLFQIRTMGFRGEAMASIAAIAQVDLKTKREEDPLGVQIEIEGSVMKSQINCQTSTGTNISVKNLFFNVPARRNFLKSDSIEFKHIIEEFQRVAIAHPEITFSLHHNASKIFHLEKGTLRQRLVGIFGDSYNERLVPLQEDTTIVNVTGFIGKPQHARKTRGEQFFFVNNRFIKSAYLHHAVQNAYNQLLPKDTFPFYCINMEIDPKNIDVNIHPTKTEIKFEDERSVYTIIRSAVKQSLGKYNITPSLDFEQEVSIELPSTKTREGILLNPPTIKINKNYNPFVEENKRQERKNHLSSSNPLEAIPTISKKSHDKSTVPNRDFNFLETIHSNEKIIQSKFELNDEKPITISFQLYNKYIVTHTKTGLIILDQQAAHERILYEHFIEKLHKQQQISQQQLFPQTFELSKGDALLLKELNNDLNALGFDINEFGNNTFIIHGIPPDATNTNVVDLLEKLIDDYKQSKGAESELATLRIEAIAKTMAKNICIKSGQSLTQEEMHHLIDSLFGCATPYTTPSGKPTITTISIEQLEKKFNF